MAKKFETKEFNLVGSKAANIIGAFGEIIAWDALRRIGIRAYKIGSWTFFPEGYPYWSGKLDEEHRFLTKEQAEFVEKEDTGLDFIGVKLKDNKIGTYPFMLGGKWGRSTVEQVENVYLIQVRTGHTVKHYTKNPAKAFTLANIRKAKRIGFKVLLVLVELLDDWKCRISYREL